jgi:hypothetical protein
LVCLTFHFPYWKRNWRFVTSCFGSWSKTVWLVGHLCWIFSFTLLTTLFMAPLHSFSPQQNTKLFYLHWIFNCSCVSYVLMLRSLGKAFTDLFSPTVKAQSQQAIINKKHSRNEHIEYIFFEFKFFNISIFKVFLAMNLFVI